MALKRAITTELCAQVTRAVCLVTTVEDLDVTQSSAILRYVGKLTGLYPVDPLLALQVDEIDMMVEEVAMQLMTLLALVDLVMFVF